jgi:hypothetical protein
VKASRGFAAHLRDKHPEIHDDEDKPWSHATPWSCSFCHEDEDEETPAMEMSLGREPIPHKEAREAQIKDHDQCSDVGMRGVQRPLSTANGRVIGSAIEATALYLFPPPEAKSR